MGIADFKEVVTILLNHYCSIKPKHFLIYQKITSEINNADVYVDASNLIHRMWRRNDSNKLSLEARKQLKEEKAIEREKIRETGDSMQLILLQIEENEELGKGRQAVDDMYKFVIDRYGLNPKNVYYIFDGKAGKEKEEEHKKREATGQYDVVKIDKQLRDYAISKPTCKTFQCEQDKTHQSGEADYKINFEAIMHAMDQNYCAVISTDADYKPYPIISITPNQGGTVDIYDLRFLWSTMYNEIDCTIKKKPFTYHPSIVEYFNGYEYFDHPLFAFFIPTIIAFVLGNDYSNMLMENNQPIKKLFGHGKVNVSKNLIKNPYFYFEHMNKLGDTMWTRNVKKYYYIMIENTLSYL